MRIYLSISEGEFLDRFNSSLSVKVLSAICGALSSRHCFSNVLCALDSTRVRYPEARPAKRQRSPKQRAEQKNLVRNRKSCFYCSHSDTVYLGWGDRGTSNGELMCLLTRYCVLLLQTREFFRTWPWISGRFCISSRPLPICLCLFCSLLLMSVDSSDENCSLKACHEFTRIYINT